MNETLNDLFNPLYWTTVVPLGVAFLAAMWKYDAKNTSAETKNGE